MNLNNIKNIKNIIYFLNFSKIDKFIWLKLKVKGFKIKNYMINKRLTVYNGRYFIPIKIIDSMVNYMINYFFFSKNILIKDKKKKKRIKKKKK